MANQRNLKFKTAKSVFRCPLCANSFCFTQNESLVCKKGHCFDISAKGYVNFTLNQKPIIYDKRFFECRRQVFEDGFYQHMAESVQRVVDNENGGQVLDAGCGEGYYAKLISQQSNTNVFAFDLSKDAIQIASRGINNVKWMVADLTNIPLQNNSIDILLNIFAPANYVEYARVLRHNGLIIKVIPGQQHLCELRNLVKGQLKNNDYSNQAVIEHFCRYFRLVDKVSSSRTTKVNAQQLNNLLGMTPLLFGVDTSQSDFHTLRQITIDGDLLIGRLP